jgi:hypothetical protein
MAASASLCQPALAEGIELAVMASRSPQAQSVHVCSPAPRQIGQGARFRFGRGESSSQKGITDGSFAEHSSILKTALRSWLRNVCAGR